MVLASSIDTEVMAHRLAEAVRLMADARELYYRTLRGVAQLWLVTAPMDFNGEEPFYRASQVLYREFQNKAIDFRVINPALFTPFDISTIIPADTARILIQP